MPKVVDHDDWRDQALADVFPLFARKGYESVTVRHIAGHLGVSIGSLYHYFVSRDAVFDQMMRRVVTTDIARARDAVASAPSTDAAHALTAFLGQEIAHFRAVLLLMIDYHRVHGADAPLLVEVIRTYRDAVGALLGASGKENTVPLLSLVLGMVVHGLVDEEDAPVLLHAPAFRILAGLH